jgi:hypothetical protein
VINMAFAYGQHTRRRVLAGLHDLVSFKAAEREPLRHGLVGLTGPYVQLTATRYGALPTEYLGAMEHAQYVVYAYGTPIAWVLDNGRAFLPDWQYSATVTYYQNLIRAAWCGHVLDPNPLYSRAQNRGTPRGRSSDARYNRPYRFRPIDRHDISERAVSLSVYDHADEQARVHQDLLYRTGLQEPLVPVSTDEDPEDTAYRTLTNKAILLDPRYADPDWVPRTNRVHVPEWDGDKIERPGESRAHP